MAARMGVGGDIRKGMGAWWGSPSAALILRAPESGWPWWGQGCRQQSPTYPPRQRAESCRRVASPPPRGGFIPCAAGGESAALCPPMPRCWVSCCNRTDAQADTARAVPPSSRPPPLLPPRAGNGPNPALEPSPASAGMPRWGAGWDHGATGGWSGFAPAPAGTEHPAGLEHPPQLSGHAGQVSPPNASLRGQGGTTDRDTRPARVLPCPGVVAHPGLPSSGSCGPGAGLDPQQVRVVSQPPADIIPINSGLCEN